MPAKHPRAPAETVGYAGRAWQHQPGPHPLTPWEIQGRLLTYLSIGLASLIWQSQSNTSSQNCVAIIWNTLYGNCLVQCQAFNAFSNKNLVLPTLQLSQCSNTSFTISPYSLSFFTTIYFLFNTIIWNTLVFSLKFHFMPIYIL